MTPRPEPVGQMAPGQVPHCPPPWRGAHLPFLLTPLMGLPSWAWGRQRGPGPLKSWQMEPLGGPHATKAFLLACQAPWSKWPVEETTATATTKKDGEVSGGAGLDPRVSSPRPEVWGLSDEGESYAGATDSVQPVLLGSGPQSRTFHEGEKGYEEGKVMEKAARTFSPPSQRLPVVQDGDGEVIKTGAAPEPHLVVAQSLLPGCWQPYLAGTTAGPQQEQESQKARVGQLGADRQEEKEEAKENESKTAEKGEVQGPFSIPPSPFLRPWVYRPEDSTQKGTFRAAGETGTAEHPFSIPPSPFLRPWVSQPGEDTENEEEDEEEVEEKEEEDGFSGAAEGAPQSSASLPGASRNVCTFFRGEDSDEEEEEEEDSDAREPESPSSLPSASLNTCVACPGKDWGEDVEDGENVEAEEREDGESEASEGHISLPSTFLRNWIYRPGEEEEEEEEEEEDSEAADTRPVASREAWSPAWGRPLEPRPFQVAFYLPGEKLPPPWDPPRPPLWLWLRLQCTKPCVPPLEPVMPTKDRKVRFSEKVTVHLLAVWAGPARAARRGPWEQMARDRNRFARRIAQAQRDLGPYLTAVARARARARLRKLEASHPTLTSTTSSDPLPATPLSPVVAPPCPPALLDSPSLAVNGRRG